MNENTELECSEICESCNGKGTSTTSSDGILCIGSCTTCHGTGKLTWIEKIFGKKPLAGTCGSSGISGTSGMTGYSGTSGTNGTSGTSNNSGVLYVDNTDHAWSSYTPIYNKNPVDLNKTINKINIKQEPYHDYRSGAYGNKTIIDKIKNFFNRNEERIF